MVRLLFGFWIFTKTVVVVTMLIEVFGHKFGMIGL